jgi:type II secretory pathway pseudopilin PulG
VVSRARDEESGFTIIEVMVSAFLVLAVAGGVLTSIGTFSKASATERGRSQAGALVQQAQEDLRALPPATLAGYVTSPPADSSVTYAGVQYTTHTTAAWVNEASSGAACTGAANITRYVRLTTTVSWPGPGGATRSYTNSTLAGVPSSGGRLIVQVFDRNKDPQPNVRVDITGPAAANATTGAGGCAEWDYLADGTYNVAVSVPTNDYVDRDGNTAPTQTAVVTSGQLNIVSFDYDRGGRITSRFWTKDGSNPAIVAGAGDGVEQLTVLNASMPSGSKTYGTPGTRSPTITTGYLFPFTTPYTVLAGTCETPDDSSSNPLYTATVLSGQDVKPTGGSDTDGIRIMGVDLTAKLKTSGGTSVAALPIHIQRDPGQGCTATLIRPPKLTQSNGLLAFPAEPTGIYDFCAQYTSGASTWHVNKTNVDMRNQSVPGHFDLTVDSTGAANGACTW